MDDWPQITCERFDGESPETYKWRSSRIIGIVNRFRRGAYDNAEAERLDAQLEQLMNPMADHQRLQQSA
jgi:hypothetical protein